jgi:hypothetical protein
MSFMSHIHPSSVVRLGTAAVHLGVSAAVSILPPASARMTDAARTRADERCRTAVRSVADAQNGALENASVDAQRVPLDPTAPTVPIDWYFGPTPRRFIAILDSTRAGRTVKVRASVELRAGACRLASWQVVPVTGAGGASGNPPGTGGATGTISSSGTIGSSGSAASVAPAPSVVSATCAQDKKTKGGPRAMCAP